MTITYTSGGTPITAELYSPTAAPRGAAVVIAHGSEGLTDDRSGPWGTMIRGYAADLAKAGFSALVPHYFDKTGTKPDRLDVNTALVHLPAWQQTLDDGLAHAATLPGIRPGRLALVGFSLGGHLSLHLRGRVPVLVEFFAPFVPNIGHVASPARHIQIHHGTADVPVNVQHSAWIKDTLVSEGVRPDLKTYDGAGHGFAGADPKNTEARKLSKQRTLKFLSDHL
jgi:carboxymethylenebutenolidase